MATIATGNAPPRPRARHRLTALLDSAGASHGRAVGAVDFLAGGDCRTAIVEQRVREAFVERAEELGLSLEAGPQVNGRNFNGVKSLTLTIYRSEGAM